MAEEPSGQITSLNYFDEEINEFVFDDVALEYLQTQLDSQDWYFFIFILKFKQLTGNNLTMFHLKLLEDDLLYKRRVFERTLVRLEAMLLVKRVENWKFKEYIITQNGKYIIYDLKRTRPKFYEETVNETVSVIEKSDLFKK
ncbi:hypothetical protein [Solibacillus sp. NPDC093137]|uniref:hypothetical protein n=1 Tax=Solibacillus sp. NPDC093137 TaxID=3390678 RepID=UPI003D074473